MSRKGQHREFERSARVAKLMREIIAAEVEAIDDVRLDSATITGVEVDNELEKAVVFFDSDDVGEVETALYAHGSQLRHAVSRQARLRRTPRLEFKLDEAVGGGGRIEQILASLDIPAAEDAADPVAPPDQQNEPDQGSSDN